MFKILAAHRETKKQTVLMYDNETNVLSFENGFVFESPALSQKGREVVVPHSRDNPAKKSRRITLLKIQLGLSCNYACDYCSQRFVERSPETSKKDIDNFLEKLDYLEFDENAGLKIELWGGEPLVYWKTIKPLVAALKQRFKHWEKRPNFSMITNGSILTPEICYWLMVNDFGVAISHDGPGQHVRGPDPFDDPEQKEVILDFYHAMRPMGRISFNSMLTASNNSRKKIHEWFVEMTGDKGVYHGEGGLVDAYDEGGMANLMHDKASHFDFRKQALNEILEVGADLNFSSVFQKLDGFITDVLAHTPADTVGQKCGMDAADTIAIDLRGNVLTCQNVSASSTSHNGESHKIGTVDDMDNVALKTSTHWRNREGCATCPVLHICRGACMYIEGEHWTASCANSYSDAVVLFSAAIERITQGFVPVLIESEGLPPERSDIWGGILKHTEEPQKRKAFPVKVITEKQDVEGIEVYKRSTVKESIHES